MIDSMDDKKTYEELEANLKAAAEQIDTEATYGHYKHPEIPYKVNGFAISEGTQEVLVRYASTEHPNVEMVRPLSVWVETVEWQGMTIPRFTKL